jgi:hypothetical protein
VTRRRASAVDGMTNTMSTSRQRRDTAATYDT